ncbi:MAG: hypothetical protein KY455_10770 [Euryarchaeota archaeon]|nr:hypothetical protein [Euryarchaeota archaeon]
MQKLLATAIVLFMVAVALPSTQAGEVITRTYNVPSGANNATCGNPACAISWSLSICTEGWDDWTDGDPTTDDPPEDEALTTAFGTACPAARSTNNGNGVVVRGGVTGLGSECGDCYFDFLVSITDTLPADTMFSFCIITDHQDGRERTDRFCGDVDPRDASQTPDDIEDPRVEACGTASLSSPVASGGPENGAVGFVFATHVDSTSGQVCLGSTGDFTVDMS